MSEERPKDYKKKEHISIHTFTMQTRFAPCPWCGHPVRFNDITKLVHMEATRCKNCKKPIEKWAIAEPCLSVEKLDEEDLEW